MPLELRLSALKRSVILNHSAKKVGHLARYHAGHLKSVMLKDDLIYFLQFFAFEGIHQGLLLNIL